MTIKEFIEAPLLGKISVSRVFWLYGIVGSLLYSSLEFLIDAGNTLLLRLYTLGGALLTLYVIVGTYRCAVNCRSPGMARFVRVSSVISLLLLPVITYLELSGALSTDLSQLQELGL
jgi:hypothetical protein